jgi:methylmalonyl-CoA mutase N-terminal domain/subunit
MLRLFSGGDGTSLTSVEPFNNVIRIAYQALAIVLSGAQAVHTISWDEPLGLPAEDAALLALRTQQIIAYETGVSRTADPLGGSYYIESLTDEIERRASRLLQEIEERGVLAGVEDGSLERMIADGAWAYETSLASGEVTIVGLNQFAEERAEGTEPQPFTVGPEVIERQGQRLKDVRQRRDQAKVDAAISGIRAAAASDENVMKPILAGVRAYATVGEMARAMGSVFGYHRASTIV